MYFPFIGPSATGRSKKANVQETINLYLEKDNQGGESALVGLPGLLRKIVVPNIKGNYSDDYSDLLAFRSPFEIPTDIFDNTATFAMTSTITEFQTGSQDIAGTLTGMSASSGDELYYANFNLYFCAFRDHYELYDTVAVDSTAASGTWSWSNSTNFGTDLGVKTVLLGDPGSGQTVSTGNATANTVTISSANLTTIFYYGVWVSWTSRTGVDDRLFQVLHSEYTGGNTVVYLYEPLTAGTYDGTLTPIDFYGEVFPTRHMIRGMNISHRNYWTDSPGAVITEGNKYLVVGSAASYTYDSNVYGVGETLGDVFKATTETTYTGSNGLVIDKDQRDFFLDFGYKTLIQDQALGIVAACANEQQTDAENLLLQLIKCQFPLGTGSPQSGNMGNFSHIYNEHGHNRLAYAITGVDHTAHEVEIDGDATRAKEFRAGVVFDIENSSNNNATGYTVISATHAAGTITIVVDEDVQDLTDSTVDGNVILYKTTVPYVYFRTGSSMMAALSLLFYMEKYPSGTGTYYDQAKAAVIKLLDHMIDTYLITTSGHKQEHMFRAGKGIINRRSRHREEDSDYLIKWAYSDHNLLAWWALHMAYEQSLTTNSDLGTAYGTLADNLKNRLFYDIGDATYDGLWDNLNGRVANGVAGFDVLAISTSGKTIQINGNASQLFLDGFSVQVQENTTAANNTTYTVASSSIDLNSVSSGSIAADIWYSVIGNITYNGKNYVGSTGNYALFQGVSGVTTFTDNATSTVRKHESTITMDETPDTDTSYTAAGDGVIMQVDRSDSLLANVLYMAFLAEIGEGTRAKDVVAQLKKYEQNPDETYDTVIGMNPVIGCITDTYIGTGEFFSGVGDENCRYPWSLAHIYHEQDSVSVASTMQAVLGFSSISDYDNFQYYFDAVYESRPTASEGYIHTTSDYVEHDFEQPQFNNLLPSINYRMQSWAAAKDTAWSLIAQKPNGFLGVSNTALTITGRSESSEVRNTAVMNGKLYACIGNIVVSFTIDSAGSLDIYSPSLVSTSIMATDSGWVDMATNGYQLLITDGTTTGYLYDSALDSWNVLTNSGDTDNSFIGGGSCTFLDGYFFSHSPDTNIVSYSNIYAEPSNSTLYNTDGYKGGLVWTPTDRITPQVSPGNVVKVIGSYRLLWILKESSTQVHRNTGDTTSPASQWGLVPGSAIEYGCASPGSVRSMDNTVYFLSNDFKVRRFNGFTPQVVSTDQISYQIEQFSNKSNAIAFSYEDSGKTFYQITFPDDQETLLYEIKTNNWVKRASYLSYADDDGRHRANCYAFFNGKHFVGDYENGWIYQLDSNTYTDDGNRIRRIRRCQLIRDKESRNRLSFRELEILFETGVGLSTGQGSDPQAMLRYSDDGGYSWSNEHWQSMGKIGKYDRRVRWFNLGSGYDRVFEVTVSDPVKVVIIMANMKVDQLER